ncbi:hypothetical protein [Shumkonia mesophila]|uniref:hypothetical protein n=1 Tax=Shumkonia mesophila TaxID=2838854 RepID=UPI00293511BC|nr:hypothetical protein [Shumkonia mesophila]
MNGKFVLRSKTIIGGLLTTVPLIMRIAGVEAPPEAEIEALGASLQTLIDVGAEAVGLALVIWGRITAKTALTAKPGGGTAAMVALLAVGLLLGACASMQAETPAQRVFAAQADFNAPLAVAVAYESQPRCLEGQSQLAGCSDPAVVDILRSAYRDAAAALAAAQTAVRTPGIAESKVALAVAAARAAVDVFVAVVNNHGLE